MKLFATCYGFYFRGYIRTIANLIARCDTDPRGATVPAAVVSLDERRHKVERQVD